MKKLLIMLLSLVLLSSMIAGAGLAVADDGAPIAPAGNIDPSAAATSYVYNLVDAGGTYGSSTHDCIGGWGDDQWSLTLTAA